MNRLLPACVDREANFSFLLPLGASDIASRVAFARRHDLGVEITAFVSGPPLNDSAERRQTEQELRRELEGFCGIRTFHGAFLDLALHSSDEKIAAISRERIERDLETATRLECSTAIFHLGFNPLITSASHREEVIDRSAVFWRAMSAAYPVTIGLENHWEPDWTIFEELFEAVENPRVGLCLDVAHAHVHSHFDPCAWLQKTRRHLVHMHWSDNCGTRDRHEPLGAGNIRWDAIIDFFRPWERPTVTLEVNPLPGLVRSLRFLEQREVFAPAQHVF